MKIDPPIHAIPSMVDAWHEKNAEPPRPHMGCSQLGHPCDRWLWLSFRWAVIPRFSGRMLRLFRRGHLEEKTIMEDLKAIGIQFAETMGQYHVEFGAHISGSVDAIIKAGVPEAPVKSHVAEFKTHSKKSFDALEKHGVEKHKPEHFIQMQCYMHGTGIDRALYVAVCKDDDRLYTERVRYDKKLAENAIARGKRIALQDEIPPPISDDPKYFQCAWCPAKEFCHETRLTKEVNCRTCAHSTALTDSKWRCERHQADDIPIHFQRIGCDDHALHYDLVPWKSKPDGWITVFEIDGKEVINGPQHYHSREIVANPAACASGDPVVAELRKTMDARVVG